MNTMSFYTPEAYKIMLHDIRNVPFAKVADGYQFASWVYDLNDTEEKRQQLLESPDGEKVAAFLKEAKEALEKIFISEDEYLEWTIHKKDSGGVAEYHKIIHDLSMKVLMLTIDVTNNFASCEHKTEENFSGRQNERYVDNVRYILNRDNPFADVTIRSQQFFYKAADGSTETLFFNTNNIVEKTDKNGKTLFTMRPGFSVTKEHGVVQKPMQKVTFSNSITEPIVDDEDHIYIHID